MASPYTCKFPIESPVVRAYSTFSGSICRKVPSNLHRSTAQHARDILLLPVRLTRLEKEELLTVLESQQSL